MLWKRKTTLRGRLKKAKVRNLTKKALKVAKKAERKAMSRMSARRATSVS